MTIKMTMMMIYLCFYEKEWSDSTGQCRLTMIMMMMMLMCRDYHDHNGHGDCNDWCADDDYNGDRNHRNYHDSNGDRNNCHDHDNGNGDQNNHDVAFEHQDDEFWSRCQAN